VPSLSTLGLFSLAALALLVVPGPSVLYIVTRSVDQGRVAGLASVLGIHTGSLVHVGAAAAGVSALLMTSALAFTTVKFVGAAYLLWLGVQRFLGRSSRRSREAVRPASLRRVYAEGVVVNVLNPKTALFFLAFLPQFVDPARGPAAVQVAMLGVLFIVLGMCSDGTYALLAGVLGDRLRRSETFARRRDRVTGAVYIGLGASAALAGTPTPNRAA
jgi:threonine/homoserine/homoserine lactone efflux protein